MHAAIQMFSLSRKGFPKFLDKYFVRRLILCYLVIGGMIFHLLPNVKACIWRCLG